MRITGLPLALYPNSNQNIPITELQDNGVGERSGSARVRTDGDIEFRLAVVSGSVVTFNATPFTASGIKGVGQDCTIIYDTEA